MSITEAVPQTTYKVGQWVRLVDNPNSRGTIHSVEPLKVTPFRDWNNAVTIQEADASSIVPLEAPFANNARVVVVGGSYNRQYVGTKGTVNRIDWCDDTAYVDLAPDQNGYSRGLWYKFDEIVLEEPQPMTPATESEWELAKTEDTFRKQISDLTESLKNSREYGSKGWAKIDEIRSYVISMREERDWCIAGLNGHLEALGLEPYYPTVTGSVTVTLTVTVDECGDTDAAEDYIRSNLNIYGDSALEIDDYNIDDFSLYTNE
jgi:hypothetical protein